ncbi:MAG: hypothetical protein C0191_00025 [Mucilaginibacter sp.]|nr:MAG: hypothetical protein C0191_00025 [Mucilaginibacter sp.]HEK20056.1 PAS domain S-box protein [Bacteroidota bacterium]
MNDNYLKSELYSSIKSNEQIFDFIQDNCLDGLWYWDLEKPENEWMNPRFWHTLGYNPNEMPHSPSAWQHIIDQNDLKVAVDNFQKHLADENHPYDQVVRYRHKEGYTVFIRCKGKAMRDQQGKPTRMLGVHNDITDFKNKEILLKDSNERNRIFVEQAPNAIAMFDTQMCYLAASQKWLQDYHLVGKKIIGRSHYEIFPEIGEDWKQIHRDCLNGAINQCDEAGFERADGSVQWITWDVRPWYLAEKVIGGLLMYTADITPLKQKEAEKRNIEEILNRTNEVARIGTWEVDLLENKIKWSRVTREIHEVVDNYEPALADAINFFREGKSRELIRVAVEDAIANGTTYDVEVELITAKGNILWARSIGQAEFKNGVCVRLYGVFQDIDEVKRSREALFKLNGELNSILNAGYVSIIGTDINGVITNFNRGAEIMLGYWANEMTGIQTPQIIHLSEEVNSRGEELSKLYGCEITGFDAFVEVARREEFESREWTYVRKDGSTFPVQLVVTTIRDTTGNITGFLGVGTDISDIKKAEKEMKSLLQITTDQNERLKNFAHIVSHNLRSHTGNIDMTLDLFREEYPTSADNEYIRMLRTALDSLKETIANLNEVVLMNTASSVKLVPIKLAEAIDAAANTVRQLSKEAGVEIINNVKKDVTAMGIPAYTDSILLNFITNGIKYRSSDRPGKVLFTAINYEKYVELTIEDNGLGIDLKRNGGKLFGMYKTFHGNKDARGIGLFITKNQIDAMGGKIEVESEVNKGTIFKIYLKNEES